MFTIEVKKRGKDEEFGFEDLEMYHQECGGGKIEVRTRGEWETLKRDLICKRCGVSQRNIRPTETLKIIQTAIDSEKRDLEYDLKYDYDIEKYMICVIQKT